MKHLLDRRVRILVVSAIAIASLPGLSAAPVVAAVMSDSSICEPKSAGSTARGGHVREPDLHQRATEVAPSARSGLRFSATIPVYFHVVHDGAKGNVTRKAIVDQIAVLNRTYAGSEGGARTGFSFRLAGVDSTNNRVWFNAGPETRQESAMKRALHKGGRNALNFYATSGAGYLGWAYFPDLPDAQKHLDGVVVDWRSMLGTSTAYAGQYDRGETGTHEVGHWLNLYHVFDGGCDHPGDYVEDTPRQSVATGGCPRGQDSCKRQPGLDSIHNYMDYSYDTCYTKFTAGQTRRMQDAWLALRASS